MTELDLDVLERIAKELDRNSKYENNISMATILTLIQRLRETVRDCDRWKAANEALVASNKIWMDEAEWNRNRITKLERVREAAIARYVTNMDNYDFCKHGNIEWNCEYCDGDKDEVILAVLAAVEEKSQCPSS